MQPGAPARVLIGAGVLCKAIATWVVLGPDDAVHVVGLNVQLWERLDDGTGEDPP